MIKKLIPLLFMCACCHAAVTQNVGSAQPGAGTSSSFSTLGCVNPFAAVEVADFDGTTTAALSDAAGNTWTSAGSTTDPTDGVQATLYYSSNTKLSGTETITLACPGGTCFPSACYLFLCGVSATATADTANTSNGTGITSLQSGAITPPNANELTITGMGAASGINYSILPSTYSTVVGINYVGGSWFGCAISWAQQSGGPFLTAPTWSWTSTGGAAITINSFPTASAYVSQNRGLLIQGGKIKIQGGKLTIL